MRYDKRAFWVALAVAVTAISLGAAVSWARGDMAPSQPVYRTAKP